MEDRKVSPSAEKRLRGYAIEKLQWRCMERTRTRILIYSVIAAFIMYLTYKARVRPELPCTILFDEMDSLVLCGEQGEGAPEKPYTIAEAV
jgi:hypothetical protein